MLLLILLRATLTDIVHDHAWSYTCQFLPHKHSPTTRVIILLINGFFFLSVMSSTFKPRLSQISLSIATDKVDNLLSCTKLQMLRESATIGCRKAISSSTTAWSFECKDSFSAAFWWSSSSLSGSSCCFDELFLILAARREKSPPPVEAKEHHCQEKGEPPIHSWLYAFHLTLPSDRLFSRVLRQWQIVLLDISFVPQWIEFSSS